MTRDNTKKAGALKASSVSILRKHYDPHGDAYIVLGALPGKHLKKYVVGWHARNDETLIDSHFFADEESAKHHFRKEWMSADDLDHPSLKKDWQKSAVYAWEDRFIMPYRRTLNEKEARALVLRVARDNKISAPDLEWAEHTGSSEYDDQDNVIEFGARDNISLLHEMAHAVHTELIDRPETPDHGPGFVRCVMELYNRYANIPLGYMLVSANRRGLLGDLEADQALDIGTSPRGNIKQKNDGKKLRRS